MVALQTTNCISHFPHVIFRCLQPLVHTVRSSFSHLQCGICFHELGLLTGEADLFPGRWKQGALSGVTSATSSTDSFMDAPFLPLSIHRSKLKTVHERIPLAGLSKLPSVPQIAKVKAKI